MLKFGIFSPKTKVFFVHKTSLFCYAMYKIRDSKNKWKVMIKFTNKKFLHLNK